MIDHGADAATVVANAATDITKGIMQISAAGLKQLFLLMYEGKALKAGETNIEKLIKAIDAGDRIDDIKIPKEHIDQLVALSQKHGVTYAVAENTQGEMIVYFPESQGNRMRNILSDMHNEINQRSSEEAKEEFKPEIKQSLYTEDINSEKTIVWFDGRNPNQHVHISQRPLKEGGCETRCFIHRQDGITELADAASAAVESYGYEQRASFEVEGLYPESKIQGHINKLCAEMEQQRKQRELIVSKENTIDDFISKKSTLEGTLYTISDANNPKNVITIYKHLEPGNDSSFHTVNEVMVFKDGLLDKSISPKEAIVGYEKYKVSVKQGKTALKQYEKILNGEAFIEKGEKTDPHQEVTLGDRKTLAEYEKEVEKMKENMPRPEKAAAAIEMPAKAAAALTEKRER